MKETIVVTVCSGTTCYVMGGAQLMMLEDLLPEEFSDRVEVKGSPCLDVCKDTTHGKPPFVKINDELMSEASVPKVLNRVRELTS